MGRFFYVNNVIGDDNNAGTSVTFPWASLDKAVDQINLKGLPGDTIKICYSGTDYTYAAHSNIQGSFTEGYGWGEGDYFTLTGYDPAGGTDRPKLLLPGGNVVCSAFTFAYDADYWLTKDFHFYFETVNLSFGATMLNFA